MFNELQSYFTYLAQYPLLAKCLTALICFLECFAGIGIFMPGTALMTMLGTLLGTGTLPFIPILLWAMGGTIAGSIMSFWLGCHYQSRLLNLWLFRRYPKLVPKCKVFFERYGVGSIFIGRFAGPMRAILPMIAGMSNMKLKYFLIADIASGMLWPVVYMMPGILLAQASYKLPNFMSIQKILLVFILGTGILGLWALLRKTLYYKPAKTLVYFILTFLLFALVTVSVAHESVATHWNLPVHHWVKTLRDPLLDKLMIIFTLVDPKLLAVMATSVTVWLFKKKQYATIACWAGLGLWLISTSALVRMLVPYTRPTDIVQPILTTSFPSGHILANVAILGSLLILFYSDQKNTYNQSYIYSLFGLWIGIVMFARVYLGAHWLSDVIGGLLLGISSIILFIYFYQRYKLSPLLSRHSLVWYTIPVIGISWLINIGIYYPYLLKLHTLAN